MAHAQPYKAFEAFINTELKLSDENAKFINGLEQVVVGERAPLAQHPQGEVVIRAYFSRRRAYLMLFYSGRNAEKPGPAKIALPSAAPSSEPFVKVANRNLSEVAIKCEIELSYAGLPAEKEERVSDSRKEVLLYKFFNPTLYLKQKLTEIIACLPTQFEGQAR